MSSEVPSWENEIQLSRYALRCKVLTCGQLHRIGPVQASGKRGRAGISAGECPDTILIRSVQNSDKGEQAFPEDVGGTEQNEMAKNGCGTTRNRPQFFLVASVVARCPRRAPPFRSSVWSGMPDCIVRSECIRYLVPRLRSRSLRRQERVYRKDPPTCIRSW